MTTFREKLHQIKAFAFDVDGVLSDGVFLHPAGDMMRTMNIKDGYALQFARKLGYPIAIITGAASDSITKRFESLGITDIYLKSGSKMDDFNDFLMRYELTAHQVLYMGDDIPDYPVMQLAGVAASPADACEEVKAISDYISPLYGGKGCARDVIEQTLKVQEKWFSGGAFVW